jgi:glycine/D-amino acid oxidase-like deaminating enzyme
VVVGGGILGCSAALHLLRSGVTNVTVVEAGRVGSGTTAAGAGFVALWAAGYMSEFGPSELVMEDYGLAFYRAIHAASDIGYRNNGNLTLALSEQGWETYARAVAESRAAPSGTRVLSGEDVHEMTGIPAKEVYAGVWQPTGIQVETSRAVDAVVHQVRDLGGRVAEHTRVHAFARKAELVGGVVTEGGILPAAAVVVAAGAWTNVLLAAEEHLLPMMRMVATRALTVPCGLPNTFPTVQSREIRLWLRESGGAYMWGTVAGYRPAFDLEREGQSVGSSVGQPRIPHLLEQMRGDEARLKDLFPGLATAGLREWAQGMPCYTPDNRLYVGRLGSAPNVVVIGGDNETGVAHGPGMGRLAAELVLDREPFVDVLPFRLDRFAESEYADEEAVYAAMKARRSVVAR